jgi:hypothetical protein
MATDIASIEARAEQATEGPWQYMPDDEGCSMGWLFGPEDRRGFPHQIACISGDSAQAADDADFIAHSRTDIPWLCSRVRALEGEIERLKKQRNEAYKHLGWKLDK